MKNNHNHHILDQLSLGKIVQIREKLLKSQASGTKVYRFESGDPDFSIAPNVLSALKDAAEKGKTHYIPNAGIPELRNVLLNKLIHKNKIPVKSADYIFVTNGAMHALFSVFHSLLDEGDEVIVPDPMWTEVVENIKLARGVPVAVPLLYENNYEYLPALIEAKITPKTKAIFINTPHNPTGAVLSKSCLLEIVKVAKEKNLWIVSDEAYEDIIYEPYEHHSVAALVPEYNEKIISIFSFSKSHAMSGLRVGYFTTSNNLLNERLQKVMRCSINGVNSVAQWAALEAVKNLDVSSVHLNEMKKEYLMRRNVMFDVLSEIEGITPFEPRGTFFIWADVNPSLYLKLNLKNVEEFSDFLAEKGIGSTPGNAFGESSLNSIRFSFSCSTQMVTEGMQVLKNLLADNTKKIDVSSTILYKPKICQNKLSNLETPHG